MAGWCPSPPEELTDGPEWLPDSTLEFSPDSHGKDREGQFRGLRKTLATAGRGPAGCRAVTLLGIAAPRRPVPAVRCLVAGHSGAGRRLSCPVPPSPAGCGGGLPGPCQAYRGPRGGWFAAPGRRLRPGWGPANWAPAGPVAAPWGPGAPLFCRAALSRGVLWRGRTGRRPCTGSASAVQAPSVASKASKIFGYPFKRVRVIAEVANRGIASPVKNSPHAFTARCPLGTARVVMVYHNVLVELPEVLPAYRAPATLIQVDLRIPIVCNSVPFCPPSYPLLILIALDTVTYVHPYGLISTGNEPALVPPSATCALGRALDYRHPDSTVPFLDPVCVDPGTARA
ncbi:hypothetical protein KAURM247S_01969 [Kitasatospora aureofaciens]